MNPARSASASMAARCTSCSTVFRVVADQLRVSDGWVRCGRCAEVFNAVENLIDLDTGVSQHIALEPAAATTAPVAPRPAELALRAPAPKPTPALPGADAQAASPPALQPSAAPQPPSGPAGDSMLDTVLEDSTHARLMADTEFLVDDASGLPSLSSSTEIEAADELRASPAGTALDEPAPLPSFLRRADRAARWRQPRVRAALGVAAALAGLGLAAQLTFVYRDLIAARWPASGGALAASCRLLGCSVAPARAIDSFSVESSGLVRIEKSNIYKLSVSLRNRSGIELALPALDLSLTDAQGQLFSRRVLRTAELGATGATLPAGRELLLQATLQSATQSTSAATAAGSNTGVAGYTIDLFYP